MAELPSWIAPGDAATLWAAHAGPSVRVCFRIQNDAGVWSCRLHPFEFLKEAA